MSERQPTDVKNLDRYGFDALPWSRPRDILAVGSQGMEVTFFLGTVDANGLPHAAGIGPVWYDGDFYLTSSLAAQKARNLASQPACTISARLSNIDMVFEGEAQRVTDDATLRAVVAVYNAGGWPAEVEDGAFTAPFNAPSAGAPPYHVYRFRFHTAFGVATTEPYGATRWRFD